MISGGLIFSETTSTKTILLYYTTIFNYNAVYHTKKVKKAMAPGPAKIIIRQIVNILFLWGKNNNRYIITTKTSFDLRINTQGNTLKYLH